MPTSRHPVSQKQLAANRADAARSTGPRTALGKARSAQNALYHPVNSQELFAVERLALTQQALLRAARLETGLLTTCLNQVLDSSGNHAMAVSKSPAPRTAAAISPRPNAATAARSKGSERSKPCGKNYRTNRISTPNPNQMKPLSP